jgi:4-amino-4-deoxy-L-arabinose transferase-like glycosyltransferase
VARKTSRKEKREAPEPPASTAAVAKPSPRPAWWAPLADRRERLALAVLLAVYFALGGLYLATVRFGNAPDEAAHLLYVQQLAAGKLPVFRAEDRANFEAHQPPLAYAVALPAYLAAGGRGTGEVPRLARYAVRGVSLLLGALVVTLVFLAVRCWLPGDPALGLAAGAVAAFLPMRLAVFSSLSNDPLTELIFCAVLLVLGLGLRDGFNRRRALLVGTLIGLGLLTKSTCALLLPVALVALFLEWRRHRSRSGAYVVNALLLVGMAFVIGGPWLARNQVLYGDPFALGAFTAYFGDRATPEYFMTRQGLTFLEYLRFRVLAFTLRSFWGVFDHMNLWLGGAIDSLPGLAPGALPAERLADLLRRGSADAPIYTVLGWVTYALIAGAVAGVVRWWRGRPEGWQGDTAMVWALCAALVGAAFLRFNLEYFQAQARYLYPAVLPIAAAMAMAWLAPWPQRHRGIGAGLFAVALGGLALYAWQGTLLRFFEKVGW